MVNIRHVIVAVVMAIAAPSSAGDLTDRAIEQMSSSQALGDSQGLGSIGNRDRRASAIQAKGVLVERGKWVRK